MPADLHAPNRAETPPGLLQSSFIWIERLVGVDTVSSRSNLPLVDLVAEHLRRLGLTVHVRPNAQGDKANLIATIPGTRSATEGGLVLSGHTDVVPVEGQEWASDPFTVDIRDGRVHGRGTTDMKSFIGVALALVPHLIKERGPDPVHLVLSYDEEVGLHGGAQLPDDLTALGLTPRYCVVGEPTCMEVVSAHKSIGIFDVEVRGQAAHSSLAPTVVNAVSFANRLITQADSIASRFRTEGPFDDAYDVPFSTVSVNQISGGGLGNTVPDHCFLRLDTRTISGVDPRRVLDEISAHAVELTAEMGQVAPEAGISVRPLCLAPGLEPSESDDVVDLLVRAGANDTGAKKAYATEAGYFSGLGIQTVVCGPGDIAQAHTADEFVSIEQVERCGEVLSALARQLSTRTHQE